MTALKIIFASFVISAGVIKAAPALAETAPTNISVVRTADLDLNSRADQRRLELRFAQAAREVCGAASNVDLVGQNDVRACRAEVLANAHQQRDQLIASAKPDGSITLATAR